MVLRLVEIRIENFKSFKGLHTVSGIDDRLTAIVGPNGSGKSNIIDSILFVLGYRARKMRHAMLRDLITDGCTDCRVDLVFNEFQVSRELHAKGADGQGRGCLSRYCLDGAEIASTELQEFLKSRGIDLENNRFLILQGEIENIAMMAPLELLGYIEDCIGTSSYKALVEDAEKEILEKDESLLAAATNMKFVETDFVYKKGIRNERAEHLAFRCGALVLKGRIARMKAEISSRKNRSLLSSKAQVEASLADLQARNEARISEIRSLEGQRDGLDIKKKEDELLRVRRQTQVVIRENKSSEAKRERIEREIGDAENETKECVSRMESWKRESETFHRQIDENSREIEALNGESERKKAELSGFREIRERERIKKENEHALISLMKRRSFFTKVEGEISHLQSRIAELRGAGRETAEAPREPAEKIERELVQLKKDLQMTSQEIQKRKRRAEEFRFVEESCRRENAVIDALKGIKGVLGPLRGLGVVETGYETAVEAATKSMGSIVVETTAVAEECISVVNRKRLNRTTFVILDKLSEAAPDGKNRRGGSTDNMLYRKIRCDEKYRKAFYFALRDTLVVETMEEAKAAAFGAVRRRVVTVDGKLLEKSGVMSGGRVHKKMKGVGELEEIYGNISRMCDQKSRELEGLRNYEACQRREAEAAELEKRLVQRRNSVDFQELRRVDDEILKVRGGIERCDSADLPVDLRILRGEVQTLDEKIGLLERTNQELKMKLSCEPKNSAPALAGRLKKLKRDLSGISVLPCDLSVLNALEEDYQRHFAEFKRLQGLVADIRAGMGDDYHEEACYKNKLEEIEDSLGECLKTRNGCELRSGEIAGEYALVRRLLDKYGGECDPKKTKGCRGTDCEAEPGSADAVCEMTDEELKAKSRELAGELSAREAENTQRRGTTCESVDPGGPVDDIQVYEAIFSEYEESRRSYEDAKASLDFLQDKTNTLKKGLERLRNERHGRFMDGFGAINKNIKEIFTMITFGGNAELDLLDYLNPFAEGVVLSIMPPKKAWKQISNLSGGEKTLASLSLIFALHKFRPSAFYIMDEIDAALDYKNVSVIAQYLERVRSQFIIISLRDNMFEITSTLVGVYKTNNASKTAVVNVARLGLQ